MKSFIIFISTSLVLYFLNLHLPQIILPNEVYVSLTLVLLFGIPHGAIDHLLFFKTVSSNKYLFYSFYLSLIILNIILWIFLPIFSLVIFLVLSAYHFGQSQFQKYSLENDVFRNTLYVTWGIAVLSGFILFNKSAILEMLNCHEDLMKFQIIMNMEVIKFLFICSALTNFSLLFIKRSKIKFFFESLYFLVIIFTFIVHPLLLSFTLFFIFNHSFEVLLSEFNFLKKYDKTFQFKSFMIELLPFSLISFIGIFFLGYLSFIKVIGFSIPLLILIGISALTLPHAVVMNSFYEKV